MTITIGLEEELQVVDSATLALEAHDVVAGRKAIPDFIGTSSCEIHRCALEVQTPVCRSVNSLIDVLAKMRGIAAGRAQLQGQEVLSAGLHPFSAWKDQPLLDDPVAYPHYARLLEEYVDVARGAMSFGLHLHFGLPDPRIRIEVMNRLRERLPSVLALSASAPFVEGRDTGMQTWRHSMLDRYPRMGVPATWSSDSEYLAHIDRLRKVGVLTPDQGMWEDMRLHHRYGTLEVRICDAVPSIDRNWLIAAMLLCEVHTLDQEVRSGRARPNLEPALIAENRWRARRNGMDAQFIDWHHDEVVGGAEHYTRWLSRLSPAAEALGLLSQLTSALEDALDSGTSSDQQRAILASGNMQDVVRHLITETARPARMAAERAWV